MTQETNSPILEVDTVIGKIGVFNPKDFYEVVVVRSKTDYRALKALWNTSFECSPNLAKDLNSFINNVKTHLYLVKSECYKNLGYQGIETDWDMALTQTFPRLKIYIDGVAYQFTYTQLLAIYKVINNLDIIGFNSSDPKNTFVLADIILGQL